MILPYIHLQKFQLMTIIYLYNLIKLFIQKYFCAGLSPTPEKSLQAKIITTFKISKATSQFHKNVGLGQDNQRYMAPKDESGNLQRGGTHKYSNFLYVKTYSVDIHRLPGQETFT